VPAVQVVLLVGEVMAKEGPPQVVGAVADKVLPDSVAPTELTAYM
jgi:hypothetical protein